jgi:hypothetical protein
LRGGRHSAWVFVSAIPVFPMAFQRHYGVKS